jgi:acetylglutamate kinase
MFRRLHPNQQQAIRAMQIHSQVEANLRPAISVIGTRDDQKSMPIKMDSSAGQVEYP